MSDPFADLIPKNGAGDQSESPVYVAPNQDDLIGPQGEQLNLPPNTGANNTYGNQNAIVSGDKINQQDPFADLIPKQSKNSNNVEEDPFADLIPKTEIPIPEISQAKPMGLMEKAGRFMSPLLGPTEAQKFEEAVPVDKNLSEQQNIANAISGKVTPNSTYEYKPYGSRLEREQGIFTPFVETPQLKPSANDNTATAIGKGVFNVGAGLAGSFMSPGGILLGGAPKELEAASEGIKQVQRGAAGLFAGQMLGSVPEQFNQAINAPTLQEKIQGGLGAVVGLGFGGLAGKHAIMGEKKPITPTVETTPNLEPSANPVVNSKEDQIIAGANNQFTPTKTINLPVATSEELAKSGEAPLATPAAPIISNPNEAKITELAIEQLEYDENDDEYKEIQKQIDALKSSETPPKQEPSVAEQAPQAVSGARETPVAEPTAEAPIVTQPEVELTTGAKDILDLINSGTDPNSLSRTTLLESAAHNGVRISEGASNQQIVDAIKSKQTPTEKKPNAVQEPSAREVGVRNEPTMGEGVGRQDQTEVPTKEGKVTKEEVRPQEVQLTDEQQADKVLLDKIDAEAGKPKTQKPKAPEENPYKEILRRYESGEEDSIDNPRDLVDKIGKVAKKQRNQYLKDAIERFHEAMDIGADVEPEIEKLLNEVKREGDRHEAPVANKEPKRKIAKDKEMDVFGEGANGLRYILDNKILDPVQYKRMVDAGIITRGGEYDFFYNSKLPKKVRDLIFKKNGSPIDEVADAMGKTPHDLLAQIQEAYISAEKAKEDAKVIERKQKAEEEQARQMERLKKTNPQAYDRIAEEEAIKLLNGRLRGEGGFIEFPDFVKDAAIRAGDAVRKGVKSFKDWSEGMIARLGEGVRSFLKDIWASVRDNWNKDIGGGFDTGGRSLDKAAREAEAAKYGPPAPEQSYAKKVYDQLTKVHGREATEVEVSNAVSRKFPGITSKETGDLYSKVSGKGASEQNFTKGKELVSGGVEKQGVGISKEAVNNQRLSRMVDLLPESERESNAEKINDALEKNKNPNFVEGLVHDILDMGKTVATPEEVALMTVEMNRLQIERQRVQDNFEQTEKRPSDYSILNSEIKPIDDKIDRLERAVDKVGTNAGRLLQMFKIMLAEDYSPIALEKKAQRQLRRELTPEEKNTIAEQARQIKELQDKLNNKQAKAEDTALNQSVKEAYERQIAELKEQSKPDPAVQRILEKVADVLKSPADKARERIAQRRKERGGRLFTGVDPERLADIADAVIIGAEKIAKGASNLAKWTSQMRSEFGDGIMPYIKEIWSKSLDQFKAASEKLTSKAPEKIKAKVKRAAKEETTREDIIDRAKAEAAAGEELSHATVYDLARSHILEGMRGEDNIMKAVHDDIKEAYPSASERDVRRAFSEYGKAKFPSKEEDKVQLRQLRTLVRLQESIDRLKAGLPALRSGLQRDRANQAIREKQTILNNLLKEVKLEPTPEELTSRLEAKKNALRNRIEDLDAQLKGKAKRIEKGTSVPLDAEAERLTSLRDAMQQKLLEVEAEERKSKEKTPEQKYNERRIKDANKKIAEIEDKMRRGDYSKAEKRKPPVKYPETELVEKQLADKRREADLWREEKEKSERPGWERKLRTASETAREVTVAGINVLYKIGKYAIAKPITTPIGEIVGYTARQLGGLGKVRGEFESGASPLKTIPAYYRGYWKAMKQFMRVLKSGHSDSELLYDKQKQNNTNWFRWIGSNLHAAIKNLPSTAKEELYREHLYANAIADGLIDPKNPSDPKNQMAIAGLNLKAYLASKSEKLQEDNKISEAINNIHRWAESPDKEGKINPYTSLTSHLVKIAITKGIYKIGLNFLKQTGEAVTGLPRGMVGLLNAHWKGLDTLTPKEMDYITKAFKVGSVPAALMAWAVIDAFKDDKDKVFGGYYEQGRKKGDVKWGDVRINGKQFSLHIPEVEAAQFVNTMARDFRKNASKTDLTMNLIESFFDAMKGVFSEAPITGPVTEIAKSPKSFAGYLVQGQVPSAVRDVAKMRDVNAEGEPNSRYAKTFVENLKKGIPGLRETLPSKPGGRSSRSSSDGFKSRSF